MDVQTIGGYQVQRELGRGAMGVVYQAFDPNIGRPVAIKVIRLNADITAEESADLRQRLIREANAAGQLSHANLVTIYQLGEDGRNVFIAMEFVKGSPLFDLMKDGNSLAPARRLDILRQIAEGLDYAHRFGVVHRDIKPANILIRDDGCVKIADFGIARMIESTTQQHMTMTGMSIGSPSYMSPEQVKAEPVGPRSDQFSLAVVAFELLTGARPFAADSVAALMHKIVTSDPLANETARAKLTPAMGAAISRALAKEPDGRFPCCADFARALASDAAGIPEVPTARTPAPPPAQARTSKAPMIAAIAAALLVVAPGAYWITRSKSAATTAKTTAAESPLVKAIAEGRVDDAKKLLNRGTDVNQTNPDGTTALMQAAIGSAYLPNNVPALTMILAKNPNLEAEDNRGRTALYRAIEEGKDEAVNLLISRKADVNHRASDGTSPLLAAVTYGRMNALKALIAAGSGIETPDSNGATPLIRAAEGTGYIPNNAPYVQLLLEKGAKVDTQNKQGRSALFRASEEGKTDAVNLLLDAKADPNQKDNSGSTPLLMAVTYAKMDTVKTLLKRGGDVNGTDSAANTPLLVASEGNGYMPNNAPLVQLLLDSGARTDMVDARGRSALYRAATEGKEDALKLLLDKKMDPNQKSNDGTTALIQAVTYAKVGTVKLLLDHGADPSIADSNGKTPLTIAGESSPYIKNPADLQDLLKSKAAKK